MTQKIKIRQATDHRLILRQKQNGKCCYCGVQMVYRKDRDMFPERETIEHLRRRSEGGDNSLDNKALACYRCNSERGGVDWFTYTSYRRGELFALFP